MAVIALFALIAYGFLGWSLYSGRISFRSGGSSTSMHRRYIRINRDENPIFFWIAWISSFIGLTVGLVTVILKNLE